MILYFRRERDGAIITRELAEAAGVRVAVSAPPDAEQITEGEALAELARLERERLERRQADAAAAAEARAAAYTELRALGLSTVSASALSGHRPAEGGGDAGVDG